jgi:hypothetical protein
VFRAQSVYGTSAQRAGKYVVTVSHEEDDWYEVQGEGLYIKTFACLSLALGEEAILSIDANGRGTLVVDGDRCMVEGVYSRLRL